jgi:hypothetical protein
MSGRACAHPFCTRQQLPVLEIVTFSQQSCFLHLQLYYHFLYTLKIPCVSSALKLDYCYI